MSTKKKVKKEAPAKSVAALKASILKEVKLLAAGKISTAFNIVQLGKELIAEEGMDNEDKNEVEEGDF